MSDPEIDPVGQRVFFEHVETGETITKLEQATGVSLPAVGDEITLSDVEFGETDTLATTLQEADRTYLVRDIDRQFSRATHTAPDPPTVYQFSIVTVSVEPVD
ncbi:hypothetical protein GS429_14845 [Natronorubrum sp. JWXQ-INN-674]|uniref:Uncharacterized protein n=1 Tax=Natronorubrum halalkaliphilum TaxID=2691917 RepID=A0A6B0VNV4_9EURY|nr:hypothetical protein [Natronorubrum halalkaliphilum]MXV63320.1 hypothetical protein [Natronorubrum halalkaliphilum]